MSIPAARAWKLAYPLSVQLENFGTPANCDIDLRQGAMRNRIYIGTMKIALVQLRMLLAAILLIAGGGIASLAGQASATGAGPEVAADVAALSTIISHKMMGHVASTHQSNHRAPCGDCLDCVHSTGSGCCSASLAAVECGIPCDTPDAIRIMAGKAVLVIGIDPETLLQPPQILA
ncbi:hypothetical protein ACVOMV_26000 (plasmid) [Mesorhizobium atlanticum]